MAKWMAGRHWKAIRDLSRFAAELSALAPSRRARLRLRLAVMALPLRKRLRFLARRPVRIQIAVAGSARTLHLREWADFVTLHDVFVAREYEAELARPPAAIVDLGAHIGLSVLYFRERFPGARILAVEPDPGNFQWLERNVGDLAGVELVNVAVGATDENGWLEVGAESWRSMVVENRSSASVVPVRICTLEGLLRDAGLDPVECLLKIDVEGAEWDVLSTTRDLDRFMAIIGDLHRDLLPVSADRFFALLSGFEVDGREAPSLFRALNLRAGREDISARTPPSTRGTVPGYPGRSPTRRRQSPPNRAR